MTQRLESVIDVSDDPTSSSEQPGAKACQLALFHETNEHIRSADQKQVSVVGAYLGMVGLVLSLFPAGVMKVLQGGRNGAVVYAFLFIVGCCVSLYQAWCRVWKVHYLETLRALVQNWALPESVMPYWLRKPAAQKPSVWKRLNIDNTFLYFTVVLNTALLVLVSCQIWYLLRTDWRTLALGIVVVAYTWFIFLIYRVATNYHHNLIA